MGAFGSYATVYGPYCNSESEAVSINYLGNIHDGSFSATSLHLPDPAAQGSSAAIL